jgi:ribosome recycling factor
VAKSTGGRKRTQTSRKKTARRTTKARAATKVELRPIRRSLRAHIKALKSAAPAQDASRTAVNDAITKLSRWLDDIEDICGPHMSIPLG